MLALGKQKQEAPCKFKINLIYTVCSRMPKASYKACSKREEEERKGRRGGNGREKEKKQRNTIFKTYAHTHTFLNIVVHKEHTCIYTHTRKQIWAHAHTHVCIPPTHMNICAHTFTHVSIHTHKIKRNHGSAI